MSTLREGPSWSSHRELRRLVLRWTVCRAPWGWCHCTVPTVGSWEDGSVYTYYRPSLQGDHVFLTSTGWLREFLPDDYGHRAEGFRLWIQTLLKGECSLDTLLSCPGQEEAAGVFRDSLSALYPLWIRLMSTGCCSGTSRWHMTVCRVPPRTFAGGNWITS